MIQLYLEETEDMLQKAEECMIRLEVEYSGADINELFRIAHTIKGSSHMVGYVDVGNLMHKIEDMLDCARNGSILFEQSIVSLCFEGLDITKKMLLCKKRQGSDEIMESITNDAQRISETIEIFIRVNKQEEVVAVIRQPEPGIISSYLGKPSDGKNTYFITFFFEEEVPMISPVVVMILNSVEEMGTLIFSSVDDNYFSGNSSKQELKTYEIIISTATDEAELYAYFALNYVEKINIVDLSRSKLAQNDHSFLHSNDTLYVVILKALMELHRIDLSQEVITSREELDAMKFLSEAVKALSSQKKNPMVDNFLDDFKKINDQIIKFFEGPADIDNNISSNYQKQVVRLIEKSFHYTKGKQVVSFFKADKDSFISRLRNFVGKMNKTSTFILLIDVSQLTVLHEDEVRALIEIRNQIEAKGIVIGIIAEGYQVRSIINIFDSIRNVENFHVSKSGLEAILRSFNSEDSYQIISKKIKDVQYG
ncbi:Hpt domain-containing protein [Acetobacterium bakii]|nr:Hpt domain-containing protein [Acetobacterium bakii]